MGTISVEADVTCSWAREAPMWGEDVISYLNSLDMPEMALESLSQTDDFIQKHNELYEKNCK